MPVCRTLDYIVNTDLHLYLLSKFEYAKSEGIEVEIELTEPITDLIIEYTDFSEIIEAIFTDAFKAIRESNENNLTFCMFYKNNELHFIIRYHAYTKTNQRVQIKDLNAGTEKALRRYYNICYNTEIKESLVTQQLIVIGDKKHWLNG